VRIPPKLTSGLNTRYLFSFLSMSLKISCCSSQSTPRMASVRANSAAGEREPGSTSATLGGGDDDAAVGAAAATDAEAAAAAA
jgi:hypothetical protein